MDAYVANMLKTPPCRRLYMFFFFRACTHDRTVSVLAVFEYIEQTYALHDNSDVGTESRVLHLGHLMTIEFFVQGTDSRVK